MPKLKPPKVEKVSQEESLEPTLVIQPGLAASALAFSRIPLEQSQSRSRERSASECCMISAIQPSPTGVPAKRATVPKREIAYDYKLKGHDYIVLYKKESILKNPFPANHQEIKSASIFLQIHFFGLEPLTTSEWTS